MCLRKGMGVGRAYELLLGECCVIVVDGVARRRRPDCVAPVLLPAGRAEVQDAHPTGRGRRWWSISQEPSRARMSRRIFAIPFAIFPSLRT
jgi:hypothetical protein